MHDPEGRLDRDEKLLDVYLLTGDRHPTARSGLSCAIAPSSWRRRWPHSSAIESTRSRAWSLPGLSVGQSRPAFASRSVSAIAPTEGRPR